MAPVLSTVRSVLRRSRPNEPSCLGPRGSRCTTRLSRVGLGLLGVSVIGLVAACSTRQPSPEGVERRSPPTLSGAAELAWSEPIEVVKGPARRGPWRMNDSDFAYVDDPTVAIDNGGRIAVAWADQERQDIFFQVYDSAGEAMLEAPVNVSRSQGVFSWLPRVASPAGDSTRVYVLWQDIVFSGGSHGGEIFFARSTDGGRSFDTPVNVSNTVAGAGKGRLSIGIWHNGSLDLAVGSGGEIHVAWTEYEGALWYRRSTDGGQTFAKPTHVAGDGTTPARAPSLALQGDDIVHLAWTVGEDPAADVRLITSTDGGITLGSPTVVGESDGHADAPTLAVDAEGTVHLVYAEASLGSGGGRYDVQYTRRRAGDDAFEPPRVISPTDANGVDSVGFPALSVDGDSNLYVVWERFPTRQNRPLGLGLGRWPAVLVVPATFRHEKDRPHQRLSDVSGRTAAGSPGAPS